MTSSRVGSVEKKQKLASGDFSIGKSAFPTDAALSTSFDVVVCWQQEKVDAVTSTQSVILDDYSGKMRC